VDYLKWCCDAESLATEFKQNGAWVSVTEKTAARRRAVKAV
jgi:hypothetical protein